MTIVLITALWPEAEDSQRDLGTFAVYELVRSWAASQTLLVFKLSRRAWFDRAWREPSTMGKFGGIRVIPTPLGPEFPGGRSLVAPTTAWIRARLQEHKLVPDVILTHFRSSHLIGTSLRGSYRGAVHVTGIHQFDLRRLASHLSFRRALDRADGIAFRSQAVRDRALAFGHNWSEKGFLALSGIGESWLAAARTTSKSQRLVVGTVARLVARKHVGAIIEALSRNSSQNWEYHVVGDGPERSIWEAQARERGVSDRVKFWGAQTHDEVKVHLDGWDVFAMPSDSETFGLAYLEAMARGCLVIGALGWGIEGVVRNGENGFLVPPGDAAASAGIFRMLFDATQDQWDLWRQSSHKTVARLTEPEVSKAYLAFLELTLEKRH